MNGRRVSIKGRTIATVPATIVVTNIPAPESKKERESSNILIV